MVDDVAACLRSAEASALPPSKMYNRGTLKCHRRIFRRAFPNAQHRFCSIAANTKARDHLPVLERRSVDDDGAQPQLAQRTLHQLLHFLAAGFDEVLAHRGFLDAVLRVEMPRIILSHTPNCIGPPRWNNS